MANQRKAGKTLIGGYVQRSLKQDIARTGLPQTAFVEIAMIRELLRRGKITNEKVTEMAAEKRLTHETIVELAREGIIDFREGRK